MFPGTPYESSSPINNAMYLSITIFGVLDGTRMGVVQEVVVAEPGFAGVTFDWQEI